ncbi:MAG: hypothetical protein VB031_03085 [Eubacteriaceae bacterium]|nr:hypothetical protein [Eubacteriaceae bacterium]
MKRIGALLALALILIMSCGSLAFASDFGIEKTAPKDGATGQAIDNMGVKVYFTEAVYSKKYQKANAKKCHLLDNKGKKIPSRVAFSSDEKNVMLVLADTSKDAKKKASIKSETKYTFVMDGGFTSADGDTMDKYTMSFKTLNQKTSMRVSMAMMGVMVVGMIFFTSREAKKQAKEAANKKEAPVNPYKESKRTGKSVEEIVAKDQKKKEKVAAAQAKKARHKRENKEEISSDNMRVPAPRPISAAGSTYKYPVAKSSAQNRSKNTNPKNQSGKQKNKNKKK